ncbi:MAG TPA: TRL domain-containing protein [Victivallales bacterium]|nr:TRL domain-containing protein [Victivallales bacterium]
MNKLFIVCVLLTISTLLLFCGGCMSARLGAGPQNGLIFSHFKGPSYCATSQTDGVQVYDDRLSDSASTHKVLIPAPFTFGALSFGWGDMSTAKILTNGKISQVDYVDYEFFNILNVYERATLTVYGR